MSRRELIEVTCTWCRAVISCTTKEKTRALWGPDLCDSCKTARDDAIAIAKAGRLKECPSPPVTIARKSGLDLIPSMAKVKSYFGLGDE